MSDLLDADPDGYLPSHVRAALTVLSTIGGKDIPCVRDADGTDIPHLVDWDLLTEWAGPWSTTERLRVQLARDLADGFLYDAATYLDRGNWLTFLAALRVARGAER